MTDGGAGSIDRIQVVAAQHRGTPMAVVGDGGNTYTVAPPVGKSRQR